MGIAIAYHHQNNGDRTDNSMIIVGGGDGEISLWIFGTGEQLLIPMININSYFTLYVDILKYANTVKKASIYGVT